MASIFSTILVMTGIAGLLAFLLSLAKAIIGNYGEVNITINDDKPIGFKEAIVYYLP